MDVSAVTLLLVVLLLIAALPAWPYSRNWGFFPSGFIGIILIVLLVALLL